MSKDTQSIKELILEGLKKGLREAMVDVGPQTVDAAHNNVYCKVQELLDNASIKFEDFASAAFKEAESPTEAPVEKRPETFDECFDYYVENVIASESMKESYRRHKDGLRMHPDVLIKEAQNHWDKNHKDSEQSEPAKQDKLFNPDTFDWSKAFSDMFDNKKGGR